MSTPDLTEKIANYTQWVASGAPSPLQRIDDSNLLLSKPDLISGAEPFGRIFGMTSNQEQAFCQWYGAHAYEGWGEWVELGSFLGSLTYPGVRGLRVNQTPAVQNRKIRVYDLFYWDFIMAAAARYSGLTEYPKEGDWYVDFYKEFISPVIDRVEVNEADLTKDGYSGEPIEFLLVDVMKYPALVRNVLSSFFPSLSAGSIVFQQDYLHFYESWVTLTMYRLKDSCRYLSALPGSGTVVFQMTETPKAEDLYFPEDCKELETAYIQEAFEWSHTIIPEDRHHEVKATQAMMYYHAGKLEEARALYASAKKLYPDSYSLKDLDDHLRNHCEFDITQ